MPLIVSGNVVMTVLPPPSVRVNVKLVEEAVVGVPVMAPLAGSSVRPTVLSDGFADQV